MRKVFILLVIAMLALPINIGQAQQNDNGAITPPTVTCDIDLELCRAKLTAAQSELAVMYTTIPGKGLMWKISHFRELTGAQKTSLIVEITTYLLLTGTSIYLSTQQE